VRGAAEVLLLPDVAHTPHREARVDVLNASADWIRSHRG